MTVPPYRALARVYDDAWNAFSRNYVDVLGIGSAPWPLSVLDLGCGTGELLACIRNAAPAAELVGVDLSPEMCDHARRRVPSAEIRCEDMVSLSLPRLFDLVTCTHDAINYLVEDGAVARLIATVVHHLAPGGTFAFDFATPEYFRSIDGVDQWTATRSGEVRQVTSWNPVSAIATTRFTFPGGAVEHHRQRAISEEDVEHLLRQNGLEEIDEFEVTTEDVPTGTLVWTARRPGSVA